MPDQPAKPIVWSPFAAGDEAVLRTCAFERQIGPVVDDQKRGIDPAHRGRIEPSARLIVPLGDEALRPGDEGVVGRDIEAARDEADVEVGAIARPAHVEALGDGTELSGREQRLQIGRRVRIERRDRDGVRIRRIRTNRIGRSHDAIDR